jgi:hypothetical protein
LLYQLSYGTIFSQVLTFSKLSVAACAVPFRLRGANIDQIFKLQKKRIQLAYFFLPLNRNGFFSRELNIENLAVIFSNPIAGYAND